jgi:predicted nucleotidyltransferase component of viral defense system
MVTMQFSSAKAFRTSLEERLKTHARKQGLDLQRLRRQVAFDRLLARLFFEPEGSWVLKGGYAMELEFESARSTVDLDLTVRVPISGRIRRGTVLRALRIAAELSLEEFFEFRIGHPARNLAGVPYGGARYHVDSLLDGRTFVKFHADISVGDVLVAPLQQVRCADWLAFARIAPPLVTMTSREQQFAEKLHAYTWPRSEPNSRVRDLVDLVLLARSNLDVGLLGIAIGATFDRRGTHPLPAALTPPAESWTAPFDARAGQCNLTADLGRAFAEVSQLFSRIGQGS